MAGAFVNHGFHVGTSFDETNRGAWMKSAKGGYKVYENTDLKQFFQKHYPLNAGNHESWRSQGIRSDLRLFAARVMPADQAWLYKCPSEYYGVWRAYFPLMRAVMVYRDRRQAVEAHVRRRGEKVRKDATRIVRQRYEFMDARLKDDPLAWRVDSDRLVDGDPAQLAPVLAEYEIDLDHRLAMLDVSPDRFHR